MGTPVKGGSVAKPKPEPTLGEILSGVDIIGTMLHIDIPRLEQQIQEIKAFVAPGRPGERTAAGATGEIAAALEDIKETLQLQNERLLSLERRLSHLTAVCEQWTSGNPSP
jgi:hypothetical protein